MSVEKKLKQIADGHFTGWSWVFDDWKSADRVLAKVEMPAIVCLMPVGGEMTFRRGKVWDSEDVALCFIDKVPRDADGEDNGEGEAFGLAEGWGFGGGRGARDG
jgi:hypothetical protein